MLKPVNIPRVDFSPAGGMAALVVLAIACAPTVSAQAPNPFTNRASQYGEEDETRIDQGTLRAEAVEVKYINKVDVPARSDGVLIELGIEEGDTVDADQVLAKVDDLAARLTVDLKEAEEAQARHKATDDVNLRDARNNRELATVEAKAYRQLASEGAKPEFEARRKLLEAVKQGLRIELAQMEQKTRKIDVYVKQKELDIAEEQVARSQIKAPATGYIEQRFANEGQWVQAGTPICTLIQMDRLKVEGKISGLDHPGQVIVGQPVEVQIETSMDDVTRVDGVLRYVSMEMDVNHQHRVWVEVENRRVGDDWLIKPGMQGEILLRVR